MRKILISLEVQSMDLEEQIRSIDLSQYVSEAPLELRTRKSLLYVIPREGKEFIVVAPPGLQIEQVLRSLKPFDFTSGDLSDNGCMGTILFQGQEIADFKWVFI